MAELGDDAGELLALVALDHAGGDPGALAGDVVELAQENGLADAADAVEDHAAGVDAFAEAGEGDGECVAFVLATDERGRAGAGGGDVGVGFGVQALSFSGLLKSSQTNLRRVVWARSSRPHSTISNVFENFLDGMDGC